jgi:hypothetical protein
MSLTVLQKRLKRSTLRIYIKIETKQVQITVATTHTNLTFSYSATQHVTNKIHTAGTVDRTRLRGNERRSTQATHLSRVCSGLG